MLLDKCVAVATVFKSLFIMGTTSLGAEAKLSCKSDLMQHITVERRSTCIIQFVEQGGGVLFYPPCSMLVVRDGVESMQGTMMFWS